MSLKIYLTFKSLKVLHGTEWQLVLVFPKDRESAVSAKLPKDQGVWN